MCALHASELREKDEQLVRFQGDLETLVYSLRQWQHAVTANATTAAGQPAGGGGGVGVGVAASVEALSGRMDVAGWLRPSPFLPSFLAAQQCLNTFYSVIVVIVIVEMTLQGASTAMCSGTSWG